MNKLRVSFNGIFTRFLNFVEKAGNALPHPATLFLILALIALAASWLAHLLGSQAINPATGEAIHPVNLFKQRRLALYPRQHGG